MKGCADVWLVICILVFFVGFIVGGNVVERHVRNKAIQAGVAHYTVDPTNGTTTFVFSK